MFQQTVNQNKRIAKYIFYQNIWLLTYCRQMEPQQPKLSSFFDNPHHPYTFYFEINADPPLKVDISLQPRLVLQEAIIQAIDKANQLLAKTEIILKKDISLYKARLTGKNFRPKTDMPALSLYQKICDLKVNEIAIQILKKDQAIKKISAQTKQSAQKTVQSASLPQREETKAVAEEKSLSEAKTEVTTQKKQQTIVQTKLDPLRNKKDVNTVIKEQAKIEVKEFPVQSKEILIETKKALIQKQQDVTKTEAKETIQNLKSLTVNQKGQLSQK